MVAYRFYYLNERDHIIDAEWVFCPGDAVAMARGARKLLMHRDSHALEIWQGKRRVDAVAKPRAATLRRAA